MGKAFSAALSIGLLVLADWAGTHWKQAAVRLDGMGQMPYAASIYDAPVQAGRHTGRTNLAIEALGIDPQ